MTKLSMLQIAFNDIEQRVERFRRMRDSKERTRLGRMIQVMMSYYDDYKAPAEPTPFALNVETKFESFIEAWLHEALRLITYDSKTTPTKIEAQYAVGEYRLDIAFPDYKLAIECDGQDYHSSNEDRFRDTERDQVLRREGWTTMRFSGSQIYRSSPACTQLVLNELMARGFQPNESRITEFNEIYANATGPVSNFSSIFIILDLLVDIE
jgi:very-short-patch-repair endonuclease